MGVEVTGAGQEQGLEDEWEWTLLQVAEPLSAVQLPFGLLLSSEMEK